MWLGYQSFGNLVNHGLPKVTKFAAGVKGISDIAHAGYKTWYPDSLPSHGRGIVVARRPSVSTRRFASHHTGRYPRGPKQGLGPPMRRGRHIRRRAGSRLRVAPIVTHQSARAMRGKKVMYQPAKRGKQHFGRTAPGDRFKVTRVNTVDYIVPGVADVNRDFVFQGQISDITAWSHEAIPLESRPYCPDFYRAINDYESFSIDSFRVEFFMQPQFLQTAGQDVTSANSMWQTGRAYSTVTECSGTPRFSTAVFPTPNHPISAYRNVEEAMDDPEYRGERFRFNFSTTTMPRKPIRVFSRFLRLPRPLVKQHRGEYLVTPGTGPPLNVNPQVSIAGPIGEYNDSRLKDYVMQYRFDDYQNTQPFRWKMLKRVTLYFRCFERRAVPTQSVPTWAMERLETVETVTAPIPAGFQADANCEANPFAEDVSEEWQNPDQQFVTARHPARELCRETLEEPPVQPDPCPPCEPDPS